MKEQSACGLAYHTPHESEQLHILQTTTDTRILRALAKNKKLSTRVQVQLVLINDVDVTSSLITNPCLSVAAVAKIFFGNTYTAYNTNKIEHFVARFPQNLHLSEDVQKFLIDAATTQRCVEANLITKSLVPFNMFAALASRNLLPSIQGEICQKLDTLPMDAILLFANNRRLVKESHVALLKKFNTESRVCLALATNVRHHDVFPLLESSINSGVDRISSLYAQASHRPRIPIPVSREDSAWHNAKISLMSNFTYQVYKEIEADRMLESFVKEHLS